MLNGFRASFAFGSAGNIHLRRLQRGAISETAPLLGLKAGAQVSRGRHTLRQSGEALGLSYTVIFHLASEWVWFFEVRLVGQGCAFDLLYGQDLGVADLGALLTNELYTAQYLGHTVLEGRNGPVICSRQNLPQSGGRFPYVQQGMLRGRVKSYATDGMQFFGLSYRRDGVPASLYRDLPGEVYQYESAYIGLETEPFTPDGEVRLLFYGLFQPDHPGAVTSLAFEDMLHAAHTAFTRRHPSLTPCPPTRRSPAIGRPYASPPLSRAEIEARFPSRRLVEMDGDTLLSFFTEGHTHVVLQAKELITERPHGTILMSAALPDALPSGTLASTNYMGGILAAQTVVGNTNLNKIVSAARGPLDLLPYTGIRLYVRLGGVYRLLTLPAAYAITPSSAAWHYRMPDGNMLRITAFTTAEAPEWTLDVHSEQGHAYDFLLTCQLVMGEHEWMDGVSRTRHGSLLRLRPSKKRRETSPYPGLHADLQVFALSWEAGDDRVFFADGLPRDKTMLTLTFPKADGFALAMRGSLEASAPILRAQPRNVAQEEARNAALLCKITGGITLAGPDGPAERLSAVIPWYAHNALIHFASPHGLEQPGGAAWGTRDVCQGPFELLLAFGRCALARAVLLAVFAHQDRETGLWPQWFMFDRYGIKAGERHGDVFLWPLKCAADYVLASGDASVLHAQVPYDGHAGPEPLLAHLRRAAAHFSQRLVPGTSLLSYGGGDWDDTLRPNQPEIGESLVSSWTQALGYQTARDLAKALRQEAPGFAREMAELALCLREDFTERLIIDGHIPGFLLKEGDAWLPLLHPRDTGTGLRCRLLPLTRSILAELVDAEQAKRNLKQIDEYLLCPDGVRLMDHPAPYAGGVAHLFCRAEQAANVGREIGLQYVHAHIRYVEAMAKLGEAERAFEALLSVTPPGLWKSVPSALPRQLNLYFSSSDGAFPNRYAFAEGYDRLRKGTIGVKGGWRLYSSGPGIYLRTLVSCLFGIRAEAEGLVIDPVLPPSMDGHTLSLRLMDVDLTCRYHIGQSGPGRVRLVCGGKAVEGTPLQNRYRPQGLCVPWSRVRALPRAALDVYTNTP